MDKKECEASTENSVFSAKKNECKISVEMKRGLWIFHRIECVSVNPPKFSQMSVYMLY